MHAILRAVSLGNLMCRLLYLVFVLVIGSFSIVSQAAVDNKSTAMATAKPRIDKVLIEKSKRKLYLMSGNTVIKTYAVSLGKNPKGHKLQEGDKRTPEGFYWIDWRKQSSKFNLAIHLSYPNARDIASAKKRGVKPGGMIMIHGTPIDDEYPEWYFKGLNWTDGCIAMMNWDIKELWGLVKDGTLVEIRP